MAEAIFAQPPFLIGQSCFTSATGTGINQTQETISDIQGSPLDDFFRGYLHGLVQSSGLPTKAPRVYFLFSKNHTTIPVSNTTVIGMIPVFKS